MSRRPLTSLLTPVGIARARHELGETLTREEAESLFLAHDALVDELREVTIDRDNLRMWARNGANRAPLSLPAPYRPVATGLDSVVAQKPDAEMRTGTGTWSRAVLATLVRAGG